MSRTTAAIVTTKVTTFTAGSETLPACHTVSVQLGTPMPCGAAETKIWNATWMKKLTANEVINNVERLAPRSGRNAIRSITTAASVVATSVSTRTAPQGTPWLKRVHIV